jgi:hypothetical protein
MQQRRRKQSLPRAPDLCGATCPRQMIENQLHQMGDAEAMAQSRVFRTRISKMAHAKLVNSSKPLYFGTID